MKIGPMEFIKEGAKVVLGKRVTSREESNTVGDEQHAVIKWVKSSTNSNLEETAGVPMHHCRAQ